MSDALNGLSEFVRRTGRNLSRIPGDLAQGAQDFAENLKDASVRMAEPTMRVMRGEGLDNPLFPTWESGGKSRLGDVASVMYPHVLPGNVGQSGTLGSYGGRLAQTAKQGQLRNAERAARNGMDNEAIRQKYGWFQDPHGDWKFEINDQAAIATRNPDGTWKLNHKALEKAYPDKFKALRIEEEAGHIDPATGQPRTWMAKVRGSDGTIVLPEGLHPDEALNRIMHEVTHKVQDWEGFNRGTNIDANVIQDVTRAELWPRVTRAWGEINQYKQEAKAWLGQRGMKDSPANLDKFDQANPEWAARYNKAMQDRMLSSPLLNTNYRARNYEHAIGEVEARDVQERLMMSDAERKAIPPYEKAMVNSHYLITKPSDMVDLKGFLQRKWTPRDRPPYLSDGDEFSVRAAIQRHLGLSPE